MARVKPRARAGLAVAELDGEAVVYDPISSKVHYLNHSAALIFGLCDGRTTIAEMAQTISEAYEMDPGELDTQIRPLLKELGQRGLVEGKAAEEIARAAAERNAAVAKLRRISVPQDT